MSYRVIQKNSDKHNTVRRCRADSRNVNRIEAYFVSVDATFSPQIPKLRTHHSGTRFAAIEPEIKLNQLN